ncbi:MAG TPA: AlpA family phage regulatory protein [Candidatus Ozemobacteraceae bacterium]
MELPSTGYARLRQVIGDKKTGEAGPFPVSPSTLWLWVKLGRFPKPIKLGPRTTVWRVEDIRAWIEATAK